MVPMYQPLGTPSPLTAGPIRRKELDQDHDPVYASTKIAER